MLTRPSMVMWPGPRSGWGGLRWRSTLIAGLAAIAALAPASKADPIRADVTMSVGQLTSTGSAPAVIGGPYQYSGTIPDVGSLPSYIDLSGPTLGNTSTVLTRLPDGYPINAGAPFNMTITFDGAAGSHPSIDITGNLTGSFTWTTADVPGSSMKMLDNGFRGVVTSASLQGWTPASGVPMSSIAPLLNPATYDFYQSAVWYIGLYNSGPYFPPAGIYMYLNPSAGTEVPEPTTVLFYLAVIAGLGIRRGARLRRSDPAR